MTDRIPWADLLQAVEPLLDRDDDERLWSDVCRAVYTDAAALVEDVTQADRVFTQLGRCSHWIRPHQTRWRADGGFAWPTGYGDTPQSRRGLPELDAFAWGSWTPRDGIWTIVPQPARRSKRARTLRIAIPARSARHDQAAVHTVWLPGPPQHPQRELVQFYGFRREGSRWHKTAYAAFPDDRAYEQATQGRPRASP